MSDKIHFIITGGTIDSYYNGSADTAVPNKHTIIPQYIDNIGLIKDKVIFTEVCMKDSRQLTQTDLKKVQQVIEKSPHKKIIITHGTYTMPDTARFLKANLSKQVGSKVIIITGSMLPMNGFTMSDGGFNLGYAIAKLDHLQPGIYLAMHGRIFTPEEIAKDLSQGKFYSIFGEK